MLRTRLLALTGAVALVAVACSDGPQEAQFGSAPTEPPTIEILSPSDGELLNQNDVTIRVAVDAFLVTDELGEDPNPGKGHIHYYRDVEVPTDDDSPAVVDDGDKYVATTELSHTWTGLENGEHTFAVQLVANNHHALDPPVVQQITVTIT